MLTFIYPKIKTLLDSLVGNGSSDNTPLAVVYDYPRADISKYPAVVFHPTSVTNEFLTNVENAKDYQFKIYVIEEANVKDIRTTVGTRLANTIDKIIGKFDEEWNQGTTVEGHRVWARISTGDWFYDIQSGGKQIWCELNLTIKLTDNN